MPQPLSKLEANCVLCQMSCDQLNKCAKRKISFSCSLTSTNITMKPAEWVLMAFFLLKLWVQMFSTRFVKMKTLQLFLALNDVCLLPREHKVSSYSWRRRLVSDFTSSDVLIARHPPTSGTLYCHPPPPPHTETTANSPQLVNVTLLSSPHNARPSARHHGEINGVAFRASSRESWEGPSREKNEMLAKNFCCDLPFPICLYWEWLHILFENVCWIFSIILFDPLFFERSCWMRVWFPYSFPVTARWCSCISNDSATAVWELIWWLPKLYWC